MPEFRCRLCGQLAVTPDDYIGKRVRCPRCGGILRVPPVALPLEVLDAPELDPPSRLSSADEVAGLLRSLDQPAFLSVDKPHSIQAVSRETPPVRRLAAVHALGILSLLVGIAAFVFCWLPHKRPYSIPSGVAGLVLAVIALMIATRRRGGGAAVPIIGALVSVTGVLLSVLFANGIVSLKFPPRLAATAQPSPPMVILPASSGS
jgi:hypothetical protein